MDNVVRKTKDTTVEQSNESTDQGYASSDNVISIPQDQEIEYMAFEEFQKLL
jgi:hypothetical protein